MMNIDLHIHSGYSDDGEFSVKEILKLCRKADMAYFAVTDHNTVRGVAEAVELAPSIGMEAISGVELDCTFMGRNFHLLGYNFDFRDPAFDKIEKAIVKQEQESGEKKISLIREAVGIPLSTEAVLRRAENKIVTGELIAEILLDMEEAQHCPQLVPYGPGGERSDNPYVNFYWDYFSQGKPAYVPIQYNTMEQAADIIHNAGGIAILAHPGQNLKGDFTLLSALLETGIDGVEVYSSYHSPEENSYFSRVVREKGRLITCGSDFHGKVKPAISLLGHGAGEAMSEVIIGMIESGIIKSGENRC